MRLSRITGVAAIAFGMGVLPIAGAYAEAPTEAQNHSQLATGTDLPTRNLPATVEHTRSMSSSVSKTEQRGIATPDHWHQPDKEKQPYLNENEHRFFNKKQQAFPDNDGPR